MSTSLLYYAFGIIGSAGKSHLSNTLKQKPGPKIIIKYDVSGTWIFFDKHSTQSDQELLIHSSTSACLGARPTHLTFPSITTAGVEKIPSLAIS